MPGRLDEVLAAIDAANAADPHLDSDGSVERPAALALRRADVRRARTGCSPEASEQLRIAARGQHVERWKLPRDAYPEGRAGYLGWRTEQGRRHARAGGAGFMEAAGYPRGRPHPSVGAFLRKQGLKRNSEVQALEDVICFVFLRFYFADFAAGARAGRARSHRRQDRPQDVARRTQPRRPRIRPVPRPRRGLRRLSRDRLRPGGPPPLRPPSAPAPAARCRRRHARGRVHRRRAVLVDEAVRQGHRPEPEPRSNTAGLGQQCSHVAAEAADRPCSTVTSAAWSAEERSGSARCRAAWRTARRRPSGGCRAAPAPRRPPGTRRAAPRSDRIATPRCPPAPPAPPDLERLPALGQRDSDALAARDSGRRSGRRRCAPRCATM